MQNLEELSDVCDIRNGFAFKSKEYLSTGVPLLRISNFDDGEVFFDNKQIYVNEKYLKSKEKFIVSKGDVLIALSGATTGKYGIYSFDFPSLLNQRIGLIKSGASQQMNSRYFFYYLNILKRDIIRNAGGAAQPNISTKKIGYFKIPLPPLKTQKSIAQILDDAAALRDKTAQLLKEYELLAQSIFMEMFGDPVRNDKNWNIEKLGTVCTKITDGTHQGPTFKSDGIPFLLISNIINNEINYVTKKFIDDHEYRKLTKSTKIEIGDLLYTSVGSYGNPAIVKDERKFCFQMHIAHIKVEPNIINVIFLHAMMKSPLIKRQADRFAIGVAQKTLNLKTIRNFEIFLPSLNIQNQFAKKIALIEQQKELAKQELQESEDLFNCLLQKAFKGELVK